MVKDKSFDFRRPLFLSVAAIIFCALLFLMVKNAVTRSTYFNIKKIVVRGSFKMEGLRYLLGENLLGIDFKNVEKRILFDYPALEKIRISRTFPDTLTIDIKARMPVAKLRLKKPYFIDSDGAILDLPFEEQNNGLPEITGLENKILNYHNIKREYLNIALTLIREYSKIKISKEYKIENINLAFPTQTFFTIKADPAGLDDKEAIKVIIGKEDIAKRLKTLSILLSKIKSNLSNIKYIDLRFKDPVTGKN